MKIIELTSVTEYIDQLSGLLKEVVDGGASIGFLPPLEEVAAVEYWNSVLNRDVRLFVAIQNGRIAGSIQVHLCTKQNGNHRAEIAKLMTHPAFRRMGIARQLMEVAEAVAVQEERSLLVLDTRKGDPSNHLYQSLGYIKAGEIPFFAKSAEGSFDTTVLYYKQIGALRMIRHAVGAIVYKENSFLVIHKTKINTLEGKERIDGEWDIVKGGIEPDDETPKMSILRELKEETGSTHFKVIKQYEKKICFDFPPEIQTKIGYEKQETTMFLVEFTGKVDNLIPVDDEIADLEFLGFQDLIKRVTHEDTKTFIIENLSEQSRK